MSTVRFWVAALAAESASVLSQALTTLISGSALSEQICLSLN